MSCVSYNCDPLQTHLLNNCENENTGGFPHVIIYDCSATTTDYSNPTTVAADIAAGRAVLVRNVKIGFPAASAVNIDSNIACRTPKVVNYDRSMSLIDGNVNSQNIVFYNSIFSGRAIKAIQAYNCDTGKTFVVEGNITSQGSLILPDSDNEFMRFEGTFSWKSINNPVIYNAPAGIF